jgi:hypothetical protein
MMAKPPKTATTKATKIAVSIGMTVSFQKDALLWLIGAHRTLIQVKFPSDSIGTRQFDFAQSIARIFYCKAARADAAASAMGIFASAGLSHSIGRRSVADLARRVGRLQS